MKRLSFFLLAVAVFLLLPSCGKTVKEEPAEPLPVLLLVFLLLVFCPLSQATERVRMHCDRSLYAPGETVWLRAWVTDEDGGLPTSKYLYVELMRDGLGSVERRIKVKERGGMFLGQMELPDDLESGWYTLRSYTRAQKDWPAEALFHTRLLIRGAGPVPVLYAAGTPFSCDDAPIIQASFAPGTDGHWTISLTDADGEPVVGYFSLSVVRGRYADFDYQRLPSASADPAAGLAEGPREYTQDLEFRVKSYRNRLPDEYGVAIMSQDIGYYYSTEVPGDRSVKGTEGQSFRIPDLDYPEETLFTVNVTGSKLIFPAGEEETFAAPFDYGPTWPAQEEVRDTAVIRQRFEGTVAPLPADDTITASRITAERKSAYYKPDRYVGPYSNVFEWRQVKLRDELQKYDDMDLMAYIAAHFAGLVATASETGLSIGRTMYTTRSGSITHRVEVSHGQAKYKTSAGYSPVTLYIDGNKEPDWDEAANMTVRDVQNLYVLRGTEAALYKSAAVVLLERRHFEEKMLEEEKNERKATIGLLPLGWQRPKAFDAAPALNADRQGTLYWNPCIRTDATGCADIALPELPEGCYFRLEGRTLDGRFFSASR